jgi:hypothetical protein
VKTLFITFGDGSSQMIDAANRLGNQAKLMKTFSQVIIFNNDLLLKTIPGYEKILKNMQNLDENPVFYRAVKSYLVDWSLNDCFGQFDVIMYCDAGSEFVNNYFSRLNLKKLLEQAYAFGGVAQNLNVSEIQFTKKKLLEYLGCSSEEMHSSQIQATWSIWKNNESNKKISEIWVKLSDARLNLWQNPDQIEEEYPAFIDHRRDQSIFSILWKRNGNNSIPELRDFRPVLSASFPIQNRRNRTGATQVPKISESYFAGLISFITKGTIHE